VPLTGFAALRTAVANDTDPALEFAQLALALVRERDVLIAISTSGNSANVVHAARVARAAGASVIALTGDRDSVLSDLADVTLRAPVSRTLEVQEYHLPIYHTLALMLEASLFA
jgi:D-sedoheptulose 7-phosphate isomerase